MGKTALKPCFLPSITQLSISCVCILINTKNATWVLRGDILKHRIYSIRMDPYLRIEKPNINIYATAPANKQHNLNILENIFLFFFLLLSLAFFGFS